MEKDIIYKISNCNYSYSTKTVIDINNLEIKKGKIYVLLGSNGSGKTTLMKLLNGLLKTKSNSIFYKNISIKDNNYSLVRKETVFVHQSPLLFTGTVYNNICYGLKLRKINKETINEKVNLTLEYLGINNLRDRKSNELSSGEIQKTAIARAIVISPEVLLLDEPIANIDIENLPRIEKLFLKLKEERNTTIIFSSHNSFFNYRMCDEIIKLENGKISI